jgi:hypothetical protein
MLRMMGSEQRFTPFGIMRPILRMISPENRFTFFGTMLIHRARDFSGPH